MTHFAAWTTDGLVYTDGFGKIDRNKINRFAIFADDGDLIWSVDSPPKHYRRRVSLNGSDAMRVCHIMDMGNRKVFVFSDTKQVVDLPDWDSNSRWFYSIMYSSDGSNEK